MRTKSAVFLLLGVVVLAWGLAYWYGGVDARFIWGLIKSGFKKPTSVQVMVNTNEAPPSGKQFLGFQQSVMASGFSQPTRMAVEPGTNELLVSELDGKIWRVKNDGTKQEVGRGFDQLLGISTVAPELGETSSLAPSQIEGSTKLLVASRRTVSQLIKQADSTCGNRTDLVTGLPVGRHQTDLALIGPDGKLYIATGSRSDRGSGGIDSHEASILVAKADGSDLRVFARGLRNPYGMAFHKGKLYVTDNGQDVPASGVPDELNIVEDGKDYGWPTCWGDGKGSDCGGKTSPVALLQEHSSADGFAVYDGAQFPSQYVGNVLVALWGANSKDPDIGKKVVRVIPQDSGLWRVEDFVTGLGNPIDVKVDPRDGSLLVLDFGTGQVIKVSAEYE